jgi:hypothetical protein
VHNPLVDHTCSAAWFARARGLGSACSRRFSSVGCSALPSQRGSNLVHETYVGKVPDATITQVHAIETLGDASALRTEMVQIAGSRLVGIIRLTHYADQERTALMDALRKLAARDFALIGHRPGALRSPSLRSVRHARQTLLRAPRRSC